MVTASAPRWRITSGARRTTPVSRSDAAVLAAVNLTDELLKSQDAAENLRRQIKSYLDEISDLKRQLFKAQNQQGHQQNRK